MNFKEAYKTICALGSRGQLSPLNIIGFLVIVIVFASTLPVLMSSITTATNVTGISADVVTVLNLLPMLLVLGIVISLFAYARPYAQQG
jgi:uncharacterized protein (UPF0333 family)